MWSCNRRNFLLSAVALAGCGYTPVYGPNGVGRSLQGKIAFDTPETPDTYALVRYLEERMGRTDAATYGLSYSLNVREEGLAVTASQVIARQNMLGKMSFSLRDLSDNSVVTSGKVSGMTGYSTTGSTVSTRAAQNDAYERLMVILGDRMINQLLLTFPEGAS